MKADRSKTWLQCGITILTVLHDYSLARTLPDNWREYVDVDALTADNDQSRYSSDFWEGDIAGFDSEEMVRKSAANAANDDNLLWSNNTIPYELTTQRSATFSNPIKCCRITSILEASEKKMIEEAMDIIMHLTGSCVKCSSNIGRLGQRQLIQLTSGCILRYGCIQHELMHTLGFFHEQSRLDRDDYVLINWDNIATEDKGQFEKRTGMTYGLPYDYQSVMHYELKAFAKDPNFPTLIPKVRGMKMGQNENLSPLDLARIYKRFSCIVPTGRHFVSTQGECRASGTMASTTSGDQNVTSTVRSTTKTQQEFWTTPISETPPSRISLYVPKQDIPCRCFDPDGYVYSLPVRPNDAWTTEDCNRPPSEHCSPWSFDSNCTLAKLWYGFPCTSAATQEEMKQMIEAMARLPLRYIMAKLHDAEYLTGELLHPVAERIIQFNFRHLQTRRATGKLRDMKLNNMLEF